MQEEDAVASQVCLSTKPTQRSSDVMLFNNASASVYTFSQSITGERCGGDGIDDRKTDCSPAAIGTECGQVESEGDGAVFDNNSWPGPCGVEPAAAVLVDWPGLFLPSFYYGDKNTKSAFSSSFNIRIR